VKTPHIPVLLDEVLESFKDVGEGYFVDCTLGYAGHSSEMLAKYDALQHIGIDRDDEALTFSKEDVALCTKVLLQRCFLLYKKNPLWQC